MQIEAPPTDKHHEKPGGERRGLVIVHTGDGFSWKSQNLEHSAQRARLSSGVSTSWSRSTS